jgi:PTS system nitrogen regulatory IIA component
VRLEQPVPFDAPDAQPVRLVFVLLVPEQATEKHLQILSELAQMFSDRALREQMVGAANADALHALIATWQPDVPGQRRAAA